MTQRIITANFSEVPRGMFIGNVINDDTPVFHRDLNKLKNSLEQEPNIFLEKLILTLYRAFYKYWSSTIDRRIEVGDSTNEGFVLALRNNESGESELLVDYTHKNLVDDFKTFGMLETRFRVEAADIIRAWQHKEELTLKTLKAMLSVNDMEEIAEHVFSNYLVPFESHEVVILD